MVDWFWYVAFLIIVFLGGYGVAWLTALRARDGGPSLHDLVTHIVGAGVLAFAGAVMYPALSDPNGTQRAQDVWSLIGPLVGGVLGYYFSTTQSARAIRQSSERAAGAEQARDEVKADSSAKLDALSDRVDEALGVVHNVREAIALLTREAEGGNQDGEGDEERPDGVQDPQGPNGPAR